ncbi:MAG: hypothetical protein KA375_08965 [Vitreoscilla sp.]|nr:hypothetical protein [Vitreoscilla sp.]MBP6675500.1 hypothetical protein [Vitreoscilla sp.]
MTTADGPGTSDCYLAVTPLGVLTALVEQADELERRLCRALLRRPADQKWLAPELGSLLPGAGRAGAHALFRMMSSGAVEVVTARPWDELAPPYPVNRDLDRLVNEGAEAAVLLDDAGLLLAHAGMSAGQAELWASELLRGVETSSRGAALGLKLDDGYEAVSCTLALRDSRAAFSPAMVPLVRRLVRARTYA